MIVFQIPFPFRKQNLDPVVWARVRFKGIDKIVKRKIPVVERVPVKRYIRVPIYKTERVPIVRRYIVPVRVGRFVRFRVERRVVGYRTVRRLVGYRTVEKTEYRTVRRYKEVEVRLHTKNPKLYARKGARMILLAEYKGELRNGEYSPWIRVNPRDVPTGEVWLIPRAEGSGQTEFIFEYIKIER